MVVPSPSFDNEPTDWFFTTPTRQATTYDYEKEECGRDLCLLQSKKRTYEEYTNNYIESRYVDDRHNSSLYDSHCVPDVEHNSYEDDHIEEILANMREAIDGWYKDPSNELQTKPKISDLFLDIRHQQPPTFAYEDERMNKQRSKKRRTVPVPHYDRDEEPKLIESSDENENFKASRKFIISRKGSPSSSSSSSFNSSNLVDISTPNDGNIEDAPLCGKTQRPQVRKEYFYSKNSKTIFRWTCCGSQAKDHPVW